jgi:prevent-host-death family protein
MKTVTVDEARRKFSDLMDRVANASERLVIERRGKPMMAWVSMDDLRRLEELEGKDVADQHRRKEALALADASRERIRAERHGVPLPDSADLIAQLREDRPRAMGSLDYGRA